MTKEQAIKRYELERQFNNCFGEPYSTKNGEQHYYKRTETDEEIICIDLDNEESADLGDGKTFFLTIQKFSKVATDLNGNPLCNQRIYTIKEN